LDPFGLLRGSVEHLDGRVEFHLSGELDLPGAEGLRARAAELAEMTQGDVILDLSKLEFLGSSGLRALTNVHSDLGKEDRRLVLRNAPSVVLRLLELTGMDEVLHLE
jgi:anti-sigma B factor antagonist